MIATNPREIVCDLLLRQTQGREAADALLHRALADAGLAPRDRGLATELFYGCIRQQNALDWLISQKSRSPNNRPGVVSLARLGLYQLFFLDKVPAHAAVNETVELAKRKVSQGEAKFLNALLRSAHRERAEMAAALQRQPLFVRLSHPEWLVNRWMARYGEATTKALLEWNNRPPGIYARVNTLRSTAEALLAKWRAANIEVELVDPAGRWSDSIIELRGSVVPEQLPGFEEGEFYIQDPSTLLAVELLDPKPGNRLLDCCAAPGGKTTLAAARMQDRGEIIAEDSSAERLKLIVANCTRLGINIVTVRQARGQDPSETWFDRVLLDVPCSNTGVMRRRVDLRWRLRIEDITSLAAEQLTILKTAASRVKRGGVLVYSTCSLEPEENARIVELFLAQNTQFKLEKSVDCFPPRDNFDGAYAARLVRSA